MTVPTRSVVIIQLFEREWQVPTGLCGVFLSRWESLLKERRPLSYRITFLAAMLRLERTRLACNDIVAQTLVCDRNAETQTEVCATMSQQAKMSALQQVSLRLFSNLVVKTPHLPRDVFFERGAVSHRRES